MATYKSKLTIRNRGIYEGQPQTVGGVIKLRAGTVLAAGDVLEFGEIGENQKVQSVAASGIGTGATTVSIGSGQLLGKDGTPLTVYRKGKAATGNAFTSPATNNTAFASAAILTTARSVVNTDASKLAGPVKLIAVVGTGATLASDAEIYVSATVIGEQVPKRAN